METSMQRAGSGRPVSSWARPLADELYLLAHDGLGRPRWHGRKVAFGLAGALLCELVLAGRLSAYGHRLVVAPGGPPADEVAHMALALLESEPHHQDLRTWLAVLMQRAVDDVAGRLMRAHLLAPNASRGRRGSRYVPTDRNAAAWPLARLRVQLAQRREFSWQDVALVGLCRAAGALNDVTVDLSSDGREYLAGLLAQLEARMPALATVIEHADAAIGDAVLHHRV